ncbi:unnamed protein product, partial [Musa banksii]
VPGEPDVPKAQRHQVRGRRQQHLVRVTHDGSPPGTLHWVVQRRLHPGLPSRHPDAIQLHRSSAEQHDGEQGDQACGTSVQHRRRVGDAGHELTSMATTSSSSGKGSTTTIR